MYHKKGNNVMNITELESKVINYMKTTTGDLDEWFFVDEMEIDGIAKNQMSGIISSLSKKNIVATNGSEVALTEEL